MSQTSSDLPLSLTILPVEIQLKIFGYVMASDAPVDLEEFVMLGRELQGLREARSKSDVEAESVMLVGQMLSTQRSQSPTAWALWKPHHMFFEELHLSQKEHYLDWLLINSTCRRFRELGKVAFFSEKSFILTPLFLKSLTYKVARNLSIADSTTALAQIRHVIAPLRFEYNARDFTYLPTYHALQSMKTLSIRHRTYHETIHPLDRPVVMDLAGADRIPAPHELLEFLRDLGLHVDKLHVDLIRDGDKKILEYLNSEVYPGLQKSAIREAKRWRRRGPSQKVKPNDAMSLTPCF